MAPKTIVWDRNRKIKCPQDAGARMQDAVLKKKAQNAMQATKQ